MAPILHEFTYQAMAHDLLPIKDTIKPIYHMTINEGTPEAEEKDVELGGGKLGSHCLKSSSSFWTKRAKCEHKTPASCVGFLGE